MNAFDAGPFSDVANTPLSNALWEYLHSGFALGCLVTGTLYGKPALEGLQDYLVAKFGDDIRSDRIKQMTGRMVRQVMEARGYVLDQTDVEVQTGDLYKTAASYKKT